MKSLGWLLNAARSPVEGVIVIFSTGLFLYACYLLSPWYVAGYPTAISAGLTGWPEVAAAVFFAVTALPGMIAPFLKKGRQEKALKIASISVFLSFLFLCILRLVIFGWIPLSWLPLLMISLSSGYIHIWLKVRQE